MSATRKCLNPRRCGSDGIDCCIPDCEWSPWNWLVHLVRRIVREELRS